MIFEDRQDAVGQFFRDLSQVEDDEIVRLLRPAT